MSDNDISDIMMKETIIKSISKVKSVWELFNVQPIIFATFNFTILIDCLISLFRKNTFYNLYHNKHYYPQPSFNCRYYIKPNDGSCGKGIKIVENLNEISDVEKDNRTICPEILTDLILIDEKYYKYDYRVWVGIKKNIDNSLSYYICPSFIMRVQTNYEFDINNKQSLLTNTSLGAETFVLQIDPNTNDIFRQIDEIIKDVLEHLTHNLPKIIDDNTYPDIMLTGWDFIVDKNLKIFVLEVNCSPSICEYHKILMDEFLSWCCTN